MKISDLPKAGSVSDIQLFGSVGGGSAKAEILDIVAAVKQIMGAYDRVLEKCTHCGQWGAVMCSCPHCGAPIDPPVQKLEHELEPLQYYHVHDV